MLRKIFTTDTEARHEKQQGEVKSHYNEKDCFNDDEAHYSESDGKIHFDLAFRLQAARLHYNNLHASAGL